MVPIELRVALEVDVVVGLAILAVPLVPEFLDYFGKNGDCVGDVSVGEDVTIVLCGLASCVFHILFLFVYITNIRIFQQTKTGMAQAGQPK
jgi:hypothetical protein